MADIKTDRLITLEEHIIRGQNRFAGKTDELAQLLRDIGLAGKIVSREINKAGITNLLGKAGSVNVQGEAVKKLDLFANRQLISALNRSDINYLVISEENEDAVKLNTDGGKYMVYMDPLDGSSNINVNVSVGSIFSIYKRNGNEAASIEKEGPQQPGTEQLAAGYVLYGSSTILVYTTGLGVDMFTLDPSIGEFVLSMADVKMPEHGTIYSVNEGYYNAWPEGLKKYVKYCQEQAPKDDRPYSARYVGSMVADIHRTLIEGGIFIYPATQKNPHGKLRLMYECNPMAMLVEQAGGMAVDGQKRIMEINPERIHQRSPIYIGSKKNVKKVKEMLADNAEEKVEA